MEKLTTKWTGFRPLLMTNPQSIQLTNSYAKESRRLNALLKAARKKGDEHKIAEIEPQQIRNDWESSVYWDDKERKFFLPDSILIACIRSGATAAKKGKDIDRAVIISGTHVYIDTIQVESLDDAFSKPEFRLECPCKLPPKTGTLVWKCRCMIPTGWSVKFEIEYEPGIIARRSVVEAIETAGKLCGVGGWRPSFGRFEATTN